VNQSEKNYLLKNQMSLKPFEVQVLRGNIKLLQSRAFFPGPNVVAALLLGCLATWQYSLLAFKLTDCAQIVS
jgi:hypothetical protein